MKIETNNAKAFLQMEIIRPYFQQTALKSHRESFIASPCNKIFRYVVRYVAFMLHKTSHVNLNKLEKLYAIYHICRRFYIFL